jgi:molybdopterin molybdotransferase
MSQNLLSVTEAISRILSEFSTASSETVLLNNALGRVLARNVAAPFDSPRFSSSSMDGYAVKVNDLSDLTDQYPIKLIVVGDIPAGIWPSGQIQAGESMRIMTGAPLPEGADAVVPIEYTSAYDFSTNVELPAQILVFKKISVGDYIRRKGADIREGELVLETGCVLRPQDIGLLAVLGMPQVEVYRKPNIAIMASGNELTQPGDQIQPGKIYNANSAALSAMLQKYGCNNFDIGIVYDSYAEVKNAIQKAVDFGVDLIITSGGVSVGAYDFVRSVIQDNGELNFWRINIRPGKPLAFGAYQGTPVIGLPGNPVSAYVGFMVFVLPILRKISGYPGVKPVFQKALLAEEINSDGRESYLRAVVFDDRGISYCKLASNQDSGNLRSLVVANAFLIVPSEVKSLPIDSEVNVWMFDQ